MSHENGRNEQAEAYDAYVDLVLAGNAKSPSHFLRERGVRVDSGLMSRMREVYAIGGRTPRREPGSAQAPNVIGEFTIIRRLGGGGMGVVYLAEQQTLGRRFALKVIRPEFAQSPTAIERFKREAQSAARLRHDNIVPVYAVGEDDGVHFLVMEYIEGERLSFFLERSPRTAQAVRVIISWIAQLSRALEYAHANGIVHRDVKPSNIMVAQGAQGPIPKLFDFGLARHVDAKGPTLTQTFIGSPCYVAPEQIGPGLEEVDGRADVYALGITLYQAVTGLTPFSEGTLERVLTSILTEDPVDARQLNPTVSRDLSTIISKAIAKQPRDRYQTAGAFADDLEALLEYRPIKARRAGVAERTIKWARRHRTAAAGMATGMVAALVLVAVFTVQQMMASQQRRFDAEEALRQANAIILEYRVSHDVTRELEQRVDWHSHNRMNEYTTNEMDQTYRAEVRQLVAIRQKREQDFYEALELIRRATALGAGESRASSMRAQLFLARYIEAESLGDAMAMATYRQLVEENDETGKATAELLGAASVTVDVSPAQANVHAFQLLPHMHVVEDGDSRIVPVPLRGVPSSVAPGAFVERVVRSRGPLRDGDIVLSREEGLIWRDGRVLDMAIPDEAELRPTATPLYRGDLSRLEERTITLASGNFLFVFEAEGFRSQRLPVRLVRGETRTISLALDSIERDAPAGYVYIPDWSDFLPAGFWIKEHEVTMAEYLEFLNDSEIQAEIDASPSAVLYPRSVFRSSHFERGTDGRFFVVEPWTPDLPVFGVSWFDAKRFAQWRTDRYAGVGTFDMPTYREWEAAAGAQNGNEIGYVWGTEFDPKWCSSNFARPTPQPVPVMQFPIDESFFGVYDMAGGVSEWLDEYWGDGEQSRWHNGGSWGFGQPNLFKISGGNGLPPHVTADVIGFRLVYHP